MGLQEVRSALESGRPYFGPEFAARQGAPRRHAYMQAVVRMLADEGIRSPVILEVGSWAGGSAVTWGRALARYCQGGLVFCVDHWQPYWDLTKNTEDVYRKMDQAARDGAIFRLFEHNVRAFGLERMVVPIRGHSKEILPMLPSGWFDLTFIDGSHAYRDVRGDLAECRRLVREGGILSGDDLELQMRDCDLAYTRRMAEEGRDWVAHPGGGTHYHPGVTLAVGEALGDVACWEGFWAVRRRGEAWTRFDLPAPEPGWPDHL